MRKVTMRATRRLLAALLLVRTAAPAAAQAGSTFTGPERLYSVQLPAGWRTRVDPSPEGPIATLTNGTAYVNVLAGRVDLTRTAPALRSAMLEEGSKGYFQGWIASLRDVARVQTRPMVRTRAFGYPALRLDVTYRRGDAHDPRTGYALWVQGDRASYFIVATAPSAAFAAASRVVAALRLDGAR
jgi:hypothetical protein